MTLEKTRFTKVEPTFFFVVYYQRFLGFHYQINVKAPQDLVQVSPPGKETFSRHHSLFYSKFKDCLQLDKKNE